MSLRDFEIVYTHACSQSRRAQPNFVAFRRKDPTKWGLYLGSWSSLDQILQRKRGLKSLPLGNSLLSLDFQSGKAKAIEFRARGPLTLSAMNCLPSNVIMRKLSSCLDVRGYHLDICPEFHS